MIGSLSGKILHKSEKQVLVGCGGVGYRVSLLPEVSISLNEGDVVDFWIHTHIKEDALDLYGFTSKEELDFFELLLGVSSIGPKSAMGILNIAPIETLSNAIGGGDLAYLTKISGIGKKTAQKILIELKDKVTRTEDDSSLKENLDALEALKTLGYSTQEARNALKNTEGGSTNEKIKEALKILGGR